VGKEEHRVTRFWDAKQPEWWQRMVCTTEKGAVGAMNWVSQLERPWTSANKTALPTRLVFRVNGNQQLWPQAKTATPRRSGKVSNPQSPAERLAVAMPTLSGWMVVMGIANVARVTPRMGLAMAMASSNVP